MLCARIDVVEAPIRHLKAYLPPLPDKKTTTADWTETIVKHDRVCSAHLSEKIQ